jgi:hypothetical protein
LRVGVTGQDEQALRFDEPGRGCCRPAGPATCTASFTARSSGPVFVFVNDVVIGIPYLVDRFYATTKATRSSGSARSRRPQREKIASGISAETT